MKKELTHGREVFGFIVGGFLIPFIFMWYNYLLIRADIKYWQWVVIAFTYMILLKLFKPIGYLVGFIFVSSVMIQVLYWLRIVNIPIFQ